MRPTVLDLCSKYCFLLYLSLFLCVFEENKSENISGLVRVFPGGFYHRTSLAMTHIKKDLSNVALL